MDEVIAATWKSGTTGRSSVVVVSASAVALRKFPSLPKGEGVWDEALKALGGRWSAEACVEDVLSSDGVEP